MRTSWKITAVIAFTLTVLFGGMFGDRVLALPDEARQSLKTYTELVELIHENYGEEAEYQELVEASIQGIVRTLDPHTSFLPAKAYNSMREKQESSFHGLGILVGVRNGQLTVISPIEGGPASKQGIRAGDVISTIEGEPTETMTLDDAVSKLKGPKDTEVNITITRRGNDKPLPLTIIRDEIPQNSVRYAYMLTPEVGYLAISDFNRGTGVEVAESLANLKESGMKRLLVDLRNNGGGLLDQAVDVADQFVPEGAKILETRGRTRDSEQSYFAAGSHPALGLPVIVLVNSGTASAAEILSGAIQDHDVGLVVGTPTWGKGLVQTVYSLSYDAGLALTTAKYYTPSGRLIQRDYSSYFDYYSYDPTAEDTPEVEPGPVFKTDLGREVYGGGGITPDVTVGYEPISVSLQYLHGRAAFFNYSVELNNREPITDPNWNPDRDELLAEFEKWLLKEEIVEEAELEDLLAEEETREYAARQIRAEVLASSLGIEAGHRVRAEGDKQIQTAMDLFGEAASLLSERVSLNTDELHAELTVGPEVIEAAANDREQ